MADETPEFTEGMCRSLRIALVQDSGHYELVKTVDADQWVDNGANRLLNDGIRWLCMRATPPMDRVHFTVDIKEGDFTFTVPGIRSLMRVWRKDAETGDLFELTKAEWGWLRNQYGNVLEGLDPNPPLYYCRRFRDMVVNTETEQGLEDNFAIVPPADKDYQLGCEGSVYAQSLVYDTDETWWTHNHPGMVVRAALMMLERQVMRNEGGAQQFERGLLADVNAIRYALAEEEMAGPSGYWTIGYEND